MIDSFVRDWFIVLACVVVIESLILQIFERGHAWRYGVAINLCAFPFYYLMGEMLLPLPPEMNVLIYDAWGLEAMSHVSWTINTALMVIVEASALAWTAGYVYRRALSLSLVMNLLSLAVVLSR